MPILQRDMHSVCSQQHTVLLALVYRQQLIHKSKHRKVRTFCRLRAEERIDRMCRHISNEGTCSSGRCYYRDVETETASVSIRVGFRVTPGGLCQVLEAKI